MIILCISALHHGKVKLKLLDENDYQSETFVETKVSDTVFGDSVQEIVSDMTGTGFTTVLTTDGHSVDAWLDPNGVLNGPFRVKDSGSGNVGFGRFKNGKMTGKCWLVSDKKVSLFFF